GSDIFGCVYSIDPVRRILGLLPIVRTEIGTAVLAGYTEGITRLPVDIEMDSDCSFISRSVCFLRDMDKNVRVRIEIGADLRNYGSSVQVAGNAIGPLALEVFDPV